MSNMNDIDKVHSQLTSLISLAFVSPFASFFVRQILKETKSVNSRGRACNGIEHLHNCPVEAIPGLDESTLAKDRQLRRLFYCSQENVRYLVVTTNMTQASDTTINTAVTQSCSMSRGTLMICHLIG